MNNSPLSQRLKTARNQRFLSLEKVAKEIGVSKQMIHKYEQGLAKPDSKKLSQLAELYDQSLDYFFRPPGASLLNIDFKGRAHLGLKKKNVLIEKIKDRLDNYLFIEDVLAQNHQFKNPIQDLAITSIEEVLGAANQLREHWKMGQDPIHNVVALLEDHHIKVIEIEEPNLPFDGLASHLAHNQQPFIAINGFLDIESKRFTLLHELGHLLFQKAPLAYKLKERFCDYFASELLLPRELLFQEFGLKRHKIYFEELKNVQRKYGIGIDLIYFRLWKEKVISQARYYSFWARIKGDVELKKLLEENNFYGDEKSNRYENLVYQALSEEQISISKAASLLNRSLKELMYTY